MRGEKAERRLKERPASSDAGVRSQQGKDWQVPESNGDLSRNVGGSALSRRQQEVFYRLDYEGKLVRAPGKSCRMKEDCVVSFRM